MQQDFKRLCRILDMRQDPQVNQTFEAIGLEAAIMLAAMPDTFHRHQLILVGALSGTSERNINRILDRMIQNGFILRLGNGYYQKLLNNDNHD